MCIGQTKTANGCIMNWTAGPSIQNKHLYVSYMVSEALWKSMYRI